MNEIIFGWHNISAIHFFGYWIWRSFTIRCTTSKIVKNLHISHASMLLSPSLYVSAIFTSANSVIFCSFVTHTQKKRQKIDSACLSLNHIKCCKYRVHWNVWLTALGLRYQKKNPKTKNKFHTANMPVVLVLVAGVGMLLRWYCASRWRCSSKMWSAAACIEFVQIVVHINKSGRYVSDDCRSLGHSRIKRKQQLQQHQNQQQQQRQQQ